VGEKKGKKTKQKRKEEIIFKKEGILQIYSFVVTYYFQKGACVLWISFKDF